MSNAQNQPAFNLDEYCEVFRSLDCPSCGSAEAKLNGTLTSNVLSLLLFTRYSRKIKVACPACLDKANNASLTQSAILGWWGIPWGPIRTIQAIGHNLKGKKTNHLDTPNDYLRSYVVNKIGKIETHRQNREKLQEILRED